jgi:ribosomal protein S12 methylthiotransferase accessory factor
MHLQQLPVSLRQLPPELTLSHAISISHLAGISRVVDATPFDRLGVPVYFSCRPESQSFCLFSGKGLRQIDAKVGAYIEAIETAYTEYGRSDLELVAATPRDVLDGASRKNAILDLCPLSSARLRASGFLSCVEVSELFSGKTVLLPAELIFFPSPRPSSERVFNSAANGVSSGSSVVEASVHGLLEVIERDAVSFHYAKDQTQPVRASTLPDALSAVVESARVADVDLHLRFVPNELGMPVFVSLLVDRSPHRQGFIAIGTGCHLDPVAAAVGAVTESAEARVSFLSGNGHGKNFQEVYRTLNSAGDIREVPEYQDSLRLIADDRTAIDFQDVPVPCDHVLSIDEAWEFLLKRLQQFGFNQLCRVVYTPPDSPIKVVRIVVPRMEFFSRTLRRVGPRLKQFLLSQN